jgi:hypothetical protein
MALRIGAFLPEQFRQSLMVVEAGFVLQRDFDLLDGYLLFKQISVYEFA